MPKYTFMGCKNKLLFALLLPQTGKCMSSFMTIGFSKEDADWERLSSQLVAVIVARIYSILIRKYYNIYCTIT